MESNWGQYPRPDFRRERWTSLNGTWEFAFDDKNEGEQMRWYESHLFTESIVVPYCYQSKLSGIQDRGYHPYVWYRRIVQIDMQKDERVLLHFGAVDYHAKVWLNKQFVGEHFGGHSSFCFDVSKQIIDGDNELVVLVEDTDSWEQPRGKQMWNGKPERCWYTPTTGIWQNVWIEYTGMACIEQIRITPNVDGRCVDIQAEWNGSLVDAAIVCKVQRDGSTIASGTRSGRNGKTEFCFTIEETDFVEEFHFWSPETPNLYDVEITVMDAEGVPQDTVYSYFGLRKISTENGRILLNNKPYYQKLILDQGYWEDGLMTPDTPESFRKDIELVKEMGFNGIRLHQKIESPQFYYWADVLGVLVWEEMPSCYAFSVKAAERTMREWMEVINRDYNHPSVITWVTLNESWGVRNIYSSSQQQNYARTLYYLTKTLDSTRLVSTNDGWEQLEESDLCAVHDYKATGSSLQEKYSKVEKLLQSDAQGRMLYVEGQKWCGQPVVLSEFGGLSFDSNYCGGWGYNGTALDTEEFITRYKGLVQAIGQTESLVGYCYTQLADCMQEVNGLLNHRHQPKIDLQIIREINNSI